ncbi:MAG: long-chain fatty acid--CoA ligase [Polyangiaceae bacterium]
MSQESIPQLFRQQVRVGGHRPALREKRLGRWQTTSWTTWAQRSERVAAFLVAHGVGVGDRVVILSPTRQAWVEADVGVLLAGAVTVPVYPTVPAEQIHDIVSRVGATAALVSDPLLAEKLLLDRSSAEKLRAVIVFDPRGLRALPDEQGRRALEIGDLSPLASGGPIVSLEDVYAAEHPFVSEREKAISDDALAAVLFTSGTSGAPRGVMLTHRNFVSQIHAIEKLMGLGPHDEQLLFLPLAHVFGKMLEIAQIGVGFTTSFAESTSTAVDDILDVNPTFFGSVPRLFEKIHAAALQRAKAEGQLKAKALSWAFDVGQKVAALKREDKDIPLALRVQHKLADDQVLSRVRARFGSRLRFALSGGAPLSEELATWFDAAGVTILEGYGLTETAAQTHVNQPARRKLGTVGPSVPGVEAKLADDGEILVRGPNLMRGYWNDPAATSASIDSDGWFHTGDVGTIVGGMLKITDRKKDIIVTAGGKNIAPQNIEEMLRRSPLIADAALFGDGRPYVVALVSLESNRSRSGLVENGRSNRSARARERPRGSSSSANRDRRRKSKARIVRRP